MLYYLLNLIKNYLCISFLIGDIIRTILTFNKLILREQKN